MGDPFEDFYDEIDNLGSDFAKFIHPREFGERWEGTWTYFAFSYDRAFEQLGRKAYEDGSRGMHLIEPLFFLARHSIELALKATIVDFAQIGEVTPQLTGHKLLDLWDQLYAVMDRYGYPPNDDWGIKCRSLVAHIHEIDPEGDRYRYPSNRKGVEFAGTNIDVEGLIKAHGHVTTYLDACRSMYAAGYS
ncbi:hypothetical protein [Tardiphaga robiniae]|uniref:HEPN domain-containing protein n=1 Tax=Tardiphaga robiniae TaxID=943830 RepID=A0A7G6TVP3_9BRAD|nr:hypothetical protein [Tardiphaga robiniae]QND70825.1 hypothetical protein HB776_05930 [Tardiphaga robiniae]